MTEEEKKQLNKMLAAQAKRLKHLQPKEKVKRKKVKAKKQTSYGKLERELYGNAMQHFRDI